MITALVFLVSNAIPVDSDTFKTQTPWGTQYFRVYGLDGLEMSEVGGKDGKASLATLIDGQLLECEIKGLPTYNRQTVQCFNEDGIDLACEQMKRGYGTEYIYFSRGAYAHCEQD